MNDQSPCTGVEFQMHLDNMNFDYYDDSFPLEHDLDFKVNQDMLSVCSFQETCLSSDKNVGTSNASILPLNDVVVKEKKCEGYQPKGKAFDGVKKPLGKATRKIKKVNNA